MTIDSIRDHISEKINHNPMLKQAENAAHHLFEDAYKAGNSAIKDVQTKGVGKVVGDALHEIHTHPTQTAVAVGTGALLTTGIIAESPALIGAAGAGTVLGALYLVGDLAHSELSKLTKRAGL